MNITIKIMLIIIGLSIQSCVPNVPNECKGLQDYLIKDNNCVSGYSIPYPNNKPTCLTNNDLKEFKQRCPNL